MTMASASQSKLQLFIGRVTYITDPSDFWMQIGDEANLANLQALEQSLGMMAQQLHVADVNTAAEGSMVLVCSAPKSPGSLGCQTQWRRAKIIRVDRQERQFEVLYTDYGYRESVPGRLVRGSVPTDIQSFPHYCCWCALAGIKPIARTWTTRGIKTFKKLVSQGTFKVCVLPGDTAALKLRVNLYPDGDDSSRSIAHEMLDADTGLPVEENVQEYLKDVALLSFKEVNGGYLDDRGNSQAVQKTANANGKAVTIDRAEDSCMSWVIHSDASRATSSQDQPEGDSRDGTDVEESMLDNDQTDRSQDTSREISGSNGSLRTETDTENSSRSSPEDNTTRGMAVEVPGFNLSGLQQRRMLSADELQRETEHMQKAMRRALLQKDMIECHRNLQSLQMTTPSQAQKWGKSDLLFFCGGQTSPSASTMGSAQSTEGAGRDPGPEDLEVAAQNCIASLYPEDKGLKPHQDYTPEHFSELTAEFTPMKDVAGISSDHEEQDEQNEEPPPCDVPVVGMSSVSSAAETLMEKHEAVICHFLSSEATTSDARLPWNLPPPPEFHHSWDAEEIEYRVQEYIRKILKEIQMSGQEALDSIDKDLLCSYIHCLAPLDADGCEVQMKMVLRALLAEAVMNEVVRDLALIFFSSYSGVLRGELFLDILTHSSEKFVKLPVGRKTAYHTDFVIVIISLLYQTLDWPVLLRIVLQDFTLNSLEKWVIFNKKGMQSGLLYQQVEAMYVSCVELLLPIAYSIVQGDEFLEKLTFILDQMREKVLEAEVEYSIRSRLLNLLLKFPQPVMATEPGVRVSTSDHQSMLTGAASVTLPSSLHTAAQPGYPGNSSAKPQTQERGCMTEESWDQDGDAWRMSCDVSVQTEMGPLQQQGSSSSSADFLFSRAVEVPSRFPPLRGRGQRRREAVLVHLSRQKRDGAREFQTDSARSSFSDSPSDDPQVRSAAQWFTQHPSNTVLMDPDSIRPDLTPTTIGTGRTLESSIRSLSLGDQEKADPRHPTEQDSVQIISYGADTFRNMQEFSPALISAMSQVSQAAYSSVFGDGDDCIDPEQYEEAVSSVHEEDAEHQPVTSPSSLAAGTDKDSPLSKKATSSMCISSENKTHVGAGNDNSVQKGSEDTESCFSFVPIPVPAEILFCDYSSDSDSCDDWTSQYASSSSYLPVAGTSQYASSSSYVPVAGEPAADEHFHTEEQSVWNSEEEVLQTSFVEDPGTPLYSNKVKFGARKKMFNEEDFPPLSTQSVNSVSSSSARSNLSLDSIAVSLLDSPKKQPTCNKAPGFYQEVKNITSQLRSEQAATSDADPKVHIGEEDMSGPSNWEYCSDFIASGYSTSAGTTTGNKGLAYPGDRGDWFEETDTAISNSSILRQCEIDLAGDKCLLQPSNFQSPNAKATKQNPSQTVVKGFDTADCRHRSPADREKDSSQKGASASPQLLTSPQVHSPCSSVPYKRGDLACMFDKGSLAKGKNRKTKYVAFNFGEEKSLPVNDSEESLADGLPQPSHEKWAPKTYYCINCGEPGHISSECSKPQQSYYY